ACYTASVALDHAVGITNLTTRRDPFEVTYASIGANEDILNRAIVLDDSALIGAGAIGNGFLRALRHLSVRGSLDIVDPKAISEGNLNRCLYFEVGDVGNPKATILCEKAKDGFPS